MTRINNIYPLVGDPRVVDSNEDFIKVFEEEKSLFLLSFFNTFHESIIKQTSPSAPKHMAYYWQLMMVLQEKGKDSSLITNLIQKDIDSRLKNIHYVQFPNGFYSMAKTYSFHGRLIFAQPLNLMFKDFDAEETKYITLAAIRIIKLKDVVTDFDEQTLNSPAAFRDFVIASIESIRKQHSGYLGFHEFLLSDLNFILEHQKVINWPSVIKGLKGGTKA
jgi:hypothetical protein